MDLKTQIKSQLAEIIKSITDQDVPFSIEVPDLLEHGDYSTNVALLLAKPLGKSPREIAEVIKKELESRNQESEVISKVEIAGPGFVNIFISTEKLVDTVNQIDQQKDTFGYNNTLSGIKVITEFTDPNPFKEFHIGHLYSNIVGESISRLIESQGAEVRRVCYQGDVGLHVAKAIWGISKQVHDSGVKIDDLELKPLKDRAKFLGKAYALGANNFEESEQAKKEIIELNKQIFEKDPEIIDKYERGKAWSLEYFEEIYERLGTKFDKYFFESEVGEDGRKLVLGYLEKGVFVESEGAVIFPGEKYGLHNRVFINSLGLPTYEAKELGLAPAKHKYFEYDRSIVITGNEINEYFKVLLKALSLIRPELAEKTLHIGHGMVRLPEGKMSSRTGNVITGEWLLDEAKQRAEEKIQESKDVHGSQFTVDGHEEEDLAEKVGVGAIKYALLKSGIGGDIAFSFDESINFEGNSGPYLQYTYVRTQSVIGKIEAENLKLKGEASEESNAEIGQKMVLQLAEEEWKLEPEEMALLRHLIHYPEEVSYAATVYSPNIVAEYLYQLAQKFNLFYAKHKVIGSENEDFRLALTSSVGQVLKNGLTLLGIQTVNKM